MKVVSVRVALVFLVSCLGLAAAALAQTSSGVITGRVLDPSDQAVPDAEVILTNQNTGDTRVFKTEAAGDFVFASVQPGTFTVTVRAPGFKEFEKKDLVLTSSERLSAGTLKLEMGKSTQSVTVQAEVTPVQVGSSERSGLLDEKEVSRLMSQGRDVMSLLRVLPGVVFDGEGNEALGSTKSPFVGGVRQVYNSMSVDGIVGDPRGGESLDSAVNMDAIAEVKVLLNNYQAEKGKSSGASINIVTKSGTRDFHGTGYYYKRHEQFNAANFFDNATVIQDSLTGTTHGVQKSIYRYTIMGFNAGGPVYWPGKFNQNKGKLFFFYSQELQPNQHPGGLRTFTVPTLAERQGDFSSSVDQNGNLIKPFTVKNPDGTPVLRNTRTIPPSMINPDMQKIFNLFPPPNAGGNKKGRGFNYAISDARQDPVDQELLRIDYNVSSKWKTYARYTRLLADQKGPTATENKITWDPIPFGYRTYHPNGALNATYIVSPTLVNELQFGFAVFNEDQRFVNPADAAKLQRDKLGIGIGQSFPQNNPLNLVPAVTFSNNINSPTNITYDGRFPIQNTALSFTLNDGVTKVWNTHTFKAGIELERDRYDQPHIAGGNPFAGKFDFRTNANNVLDSGNTYANALLGYFDSYVETTGRPDYRPITKLVEWYAQDTWRALPRLTLDYGMRFTWDIPQAIKEGATFVPSRYDPSQAPRLYQPCVVGTTRSACNPLNPGDVQNAALIGQLVNGSGSFTDGLVQVGDPNYPRALVDSQGLLLGPRFGFAYDLFGDGKTAIRGGLGVFYNARSAAGVGGDLAINPPLASSQRQNFGTVATLLSKPDFQSPLGVGKAIERAAHRPTFYNWHLGIQRSVGFQTVVDVAYVGNAGNHLGQERQINSLPFGARFLPQSLDATNQNKPLPDDFLRPYLGYGNIPYLEFAGNSNYHSLQTTVNRRFSHGLGLGAAWTWSKAMDYADSDTSKVATFISPRNYNYGPASFDRTHILNLHWLYDLPKASHLWNARGVRAVFDNWQLSGIASFVSGAPKGVTLNTGGTDILGGGDAARVVLIGDPVLPKSQRTPEHYINTTNVFAKPAVGDPGNAAKILFRGPGVNNWDFSFIKNIPVRERVGLTFRWETYNTFNHTQFTDHGMGTQASFDAQGVESNATLGVISEARAPRIMQFALRLSF